MGSTPLRLRSERIQDEPTRTIIYLIGLLLLMLMAALVSSNIWPFRQTIIISETGFEIRRGRRDRIVLWDAIKDVRRYPAGDRKLRLIRVRMFEGPRLLLRGFYEMDKLMSLINKGVETARGG